MQALAGKVVIRGGDIAAFDLGYEYAQIAQLRRFRRIIQFASTRLPDLQAAPALQAGRQDSITRLGLAARIRQHSLSHPLVGQNRNVEPEMFPIPLPRFIGTLHTDTDLLQAADNFFFHDFSLESTNIRFFIIPPPHREQPHRNHSPTCAIPATGEQIAGLCSREPWWPTVCVQNVGSCSRGPHLPVVGVQINVFCSPYFRKRKPRTCESCFF